MAASVRVSVIVPCFNAGAFLAEAIDSIVREAATDDEIIVIDDGSSDDSAMIAAGYGSRVRLVSQGNAGASAARNAGLASASGEFIAFLDADDVWTAQSLSRRIAYLQTHRGADMVFGMIEHFFTPGLAPAERANLQCPPDAKLARFAGTTLLRRHCFDRVGGFDPALSVGETIDWMARAQDAGLRSDPLAEIVLRRRIHRSNTVRQVVGLHPDYLKALRASLNRRRASLAPAP